MKLWLKDSERKPDPVAVKTDDRKAVLAGFALWVAALIVMLAARAEATLVWTCAIGVALGAIGLVYTQRRRSKRDAGEMPTAAPEPTTPTSE